MSKIYKLLTLDVSGLHNAVTTQHYEFNDANYIWGPNGSGKTTVLQAIQLALLGYIPGLDKRPSDIFKHANQNDRIMIKLTLDCDGTAVTIIRTWTAARGTVVSDVKVVPMGYDIASIVKDITLPVFDFNTFIGMTANQLKDWFISFMPNSNGSVDWEAALYQAGVPDEIFDEMLASVTDAADGYTGVDAVRAVNQRMKDLKAEYTRERDTLQNTLRTLVFYDDITPEMTQESVQKELEDLWAKRNALAKYEADKLAYDNAVKANDRLNDIIANLVKSMSDEPTFSYEEIQKVVDDKQVLMDRLAALKSQLIDADKNIAECDGSVISCQKDIKALAAIIASKGVCTYTKEICPSIVNMIDDKLRPQVESLKADLDTILANKSDWIAKRAAAESEIAGVAADLDKLNDKHTAMIMCNDTHKRNAETLDVYKAQLTDLSEVPQCPVTDTVESIKLRTEALQNTLTKIAANKAYTDMYDSISEKVSLALYKLDAAKALEKLTGPNGIQSSMMKEPFDALAQSIDVYLNPFFPEGHTTFYITDKANSFSLGVTRKGEYVPYDLLSSGEKCMFAIALMCYVIAQTSGMHLLLMDDAFDHLDDDNMVKILQFMATYAETHSEYIQFIVAGAKKPATDVQPSIIIEVVSE